MKPAGKLAGASNTGAASSPLVQAIQHVSKDVLPGFWVFPALGVIPWLFGYRFTGSLTIFAGGLIWLGVPPQRRSLRAAVETALFLGVASFVIELTLVRSR